MKFFFTLIFLAFALLGCESKEEKYLPSTCYFVIEAGLDISEDYYINHIEATSPYHHFLFNKDFLHDYSFSFLREIYLSGDCVFLRKYVPILYPHPFQKREIDFDAYEGVRKSVSPTLEEARQLGLIGPDDPAAMLD